MHAQLVATDLADGGTLIPFSPISGATPPPSTHTYYLEIEFYDDPPYPAGTPRPATATNYAHFNDIAMVLPADGGPAAPSVLEIVSADQTLPSNKVRAGDLGCSLGVQRTYSRCWCAAPSHGHQLRTLHLAAVLGGW